MTQIKLKATEHHEPEFRSGSTVQYLYGSGGDREICAAAMVSSAGYDAPAVAAELKPEKLEGLIDTLIRKRHGTPFEQNSMTIFVEAPIFVFREWHRHRIGHSYSEASARYQAKMRPIFWVPRPERPLIKQGKPMDPIFVQGTPEQIKRTEGTMVQSYVEAWARYESLLMDGVANEVARSVLPTGIYSAMVTTMNVRSCLNFLALRTHEPTAKFPSKPQLEIEEAARKLEVILAERFPVTYASFNKHGRVGP